jgi:hypothetical protein
MCDPLRGLLKSPLYIWAEYARKSETAAWYRPGNAQSRDNQMSFKYEPQVQNHKDKH